MLQSFAKANTLLLLPIHISLLTLKISYDFKTQGPPGEPQGGAIFLFLFFLGGGGGGGLSLVKVNKKNIKVVFILMHN